MAQVMETIDFHGLSDAISERILKLISSGTLKPGDPLPSQRQLAAQMGVSLSSLREALNGLAAVGVIEVKHGRGTFVCDHPADSLIKQLDWALLLQTDETRELMEARRVIDVSLAGYAAQRATDEHIANLTALANAMFESWQARDLHRLDAQDIQFHLAIAATAGNSLLFHLAQSLYAVAERFMRLVPHTRAGMENHRRVLEAIARHDSGEAQEAMRILLERTEQLFDGQRHPATRGRPT